jgi:protein transport protein SEC24
MSNDTPTYYFSGLDGTGKRLDEAYRPELLRGSVEFVVSKDYCFREIQNPIFLFIIDISILAIKSGLTIASVDAIRSVLPFLVKDSKVGIITYDSNIHFYNVKERDANTYTTSITITDADDPVPGMPQSQWIYDASSNDKINYLLDTITSRIGIDSSNNISNNFIPFNCATAAIKVAQVALEHTGGKVLLFASHYSTIGYGQTKNKESVASYTTSSEFFLYGNIDSQQSLRKANNSDANTHKDYTELGQKLASSQICVHIMFNMPSSLYIDIPYYSYLTDICGGKLHLIEGMIVTITTTIIIIIIIIIIVIIFASIIIVFIT